MPRRDPNFLSNLWLSKISCKNFIALGVVSKKKSLHYLFEKPIPYDFSLYSSTKMSQLIETAKSKYLQFLKTLNIIYIIYTYM